MNDLSNFFTGILASNKWPARWNCGEWTDFHGWLYIVSDLMIWAAYFLIPVIILKYFSSKRAIIHFEKVYLLFAAFILLCGSTHLIDAIMFWLPVYRLNALVRFATGVVSLFTVYQLIKILPVAFKQKTNIELENEIARRMEAEKKLDTANKSLEAFAYVASHDLQEPLRKLRIYTSLLCNANTDMLDEKSKDYTDKILSSSARMQTMISDILTLSSVTDETEFGKASLNVAIDDALEDLEIKILQTAAEIYVEELPAVKGNEVYLTQLFANLIGNAIKFSTEVPVINISGTLKGDKAVIYIKDNGIGMNEADTLKIFNPFQRLHRKVDYEGSGIGLSICKKIVDLHKGQIRVESKIGEGTTFIVELPAATA